MLGPLSILSLDQGKLNRPPRDDAEHFVRLGNATPTDDPNPAPPESGLRLRALAVRLWPQRAQA